MNPRSRPGRPGTVGRGGPGHCALVIRTPGPAESQRRTRNRGGRIGPGGHRDGTVQRRTHRDGT
eukprot:26683-Hanusia_phi.AAC.1